MKEPGSLRALVGLVVIALIVGFAMVAIDASVTTAAIGWALLGVGAFALVMYLAASAIVEAIEHSRPGNDKGPGV